LRCGVSYLEAIQEGYQDGGDHRGGLGMSIPIKNEGFRLALCCGHQDEEDDDYLCFADAKTPAVRKLFKKIDATRQLTRLTEAMREILASDAEIRHVVWSEPS